ncbi:hypothetical protein [Ramlibacter sp.]|uniref:hypothetical protein n=1 Tax=Ramlibacter sp. TaxID=1917967 RepID=UPI003D0BE58C
MCTEACAGPAKGNCQQGDLCPLRLHRVAALEAAAAVERAAFRPIRFAPHVIDGPHVPQRAVRLGRKSLIALFLASCALAYLVGRVLGLLP